MKRAALKVGKGIKEYMLKSVLAKAFESTRFVSTLAGIAITGGIFADPPDLNRLILMWIGIEIYVVCETIWKWINAKYAIELDERGKPVTQEGGFSRLTIMPILLILCILLVIFSGCSSNPPPAPPVDAPAIAAVAEVSADSRPTRRPPAGLRAGGLSDDSGADYPVVHFAYDSSIIDASYYEPLRRTAIRLRNSGRSVVIEGHCDDRGASEFNMGLGDARASSVARFLVNMGVESRKVTPVSYGEERPLCRHSGERCWSQNRRAAFRLSNGE